MEKNIALIIFWYTYFEVIDLKDIILNEESTGEKKKFFDYFQAYTRFYKMHHTMFPQKHISLPELFTERIVRYFLGLKKISEEYAKKNGFGTRDFDAIDNEENIYEIKSTVVGKSTTFSKKHLSKYIWCYVQPLDNLIELFLLDKQKILSKLEKTDRERQSLSLNGCVEKRIVKIKIEPSTK